MKKDFNLLKERIGECFIDHLKTNIETFNESDKISLNDFDHLMLAWSNVFMNIIIAYIACSKDNFNDVQESAKGLLAVVSNDIDKIDIEEVKFNVIKEFGKTYN